MSSSNPKHLGRKLPKPKVCVASLEVNVRGRKRLLDALRSSMLPESQKGARCDFSVRSAPNGKALILRFVAEDLVALRASFNTNLRLVSAALRTVESAADMGEVMVPPERVQKD